MGRVAEIADMIRGEIFEDPNSPYTVQLKTGKEGRHGQIKLKTKQVLALSQPTSEQDRRRLEEGDQLKESRFWAMVDDNFVERGDRIEHKNRSGVVELFEVKLIQDWLETLKAIAVKVG